MPASTYLAARTRWFDDAVLAAVAHAASQVIILGAGYDDRALRFRTPGVTFVEVDLPETQEDKRERLARLGVDASDIHFFPADLSSPDALAGVPALTDDRPTYVVCEALIPYLPADAVEPLARAVAHLPGTERHLAIEMPMKSDGMAARVLGLITRLTGESVRTSYTSTAEADAPLVAGGWRVDSRVSARELGLRGATAAIVYVTATS